MKSRTAQHNLSLIKAHSEVHWTCCTYVPYPGLCEKALEVIKPPELSWRALLLRESTGNSEGSNPWLEESETEQSDTCKISNEVSTTNILMPNQRLKMF